MHIPIIHRYLIKEVIGNFVAILLVLMLILLGGVFVKLLAKVAEGSLEFGLVMPLLLWSSVASLDTLLVVSAFLAVLLTMGTLYSNSEIYALRTMGLGDGALVRIFLWFGGGVALILALLVSLVSPYAAVKTEQLRQAAATRFDLGLVTPGRFISLPGSDKVVFADRRDGKRGDLQDVYYFSGRGNNLKVIVSSQARQVEEDDKNRFLDLGSGRIYQGAPGSDRYVSGRFEHSQVLLPSLPAVNRVRVKMLPLMALLGQQDLARIAELHWRISFPVSMIILTFLAIPLSHTSPRQGRFGRVAVAILLYVLYANLLGLGKSWLQSGVVPAWLGLWWVHALFMVLFFLLLVKYSGVRPWRRWRRVAAA